MKKYALPSYVKFNYNNVVIPNLANLIIKIMYTYLKNWLKKAWGTNNSIWWEKVGF